MIKLANYFYSQIKILFTKNNKIYLLVQLLIIFPINVFQVRRRIVTNYMY